MIGKVLRNFNDPSHVSVQMVVREAMEDDKGVVASLRHMHDFAQLEEVKQQPLDGAPDLRKFPIPEPSSEDEYNFSDSE